LGPTVIQFQARLALGLPPDTEISNTSSLSWSSLPGDFSLPQSTYNGFSTERFYDPGSLVNVYIVQSTFVIRVPGLPATGFPPDLRTVLPLQPLERRYSYLPGLSLSIPSLNIQVPIVGVPLLDGLWDLTWLWNQAGWLNGTAFPTWTGNSVLTAHVYLPNGKPGPFANLHTLTWDDPIIVQLDQQRSIYKVREVLLVQPDDLTVLRHEESAWLTLITCREFDDNSHSYRWRLVVRAKLASVE
jgi:LPXTG-site transpeptidase (sortase) family protein